MARQEAHITGSVLTWAIDESGLTRDEVADKLKVGVSDVKAWESETARPSRGNLTNLAKSLHRPSAIFYLPDPPIHQSLPLSFRKAPGLGQHTLSSKELLKIREATRLQDMLSWIREDAGKVAVDFAEYEIDQCPEVAACKVRNALGVSVEDQISWLDCNQAFQEWRVALEEKSVVVLQQSLGKGNIRGFAVWNEYTPLVAINTAYHKTARIYTLFHEVGHLCLRKDATCLEFASPARGKIASRLPVERWCEQFSAAFLMPEPEFVEIVNGLLPHDSKFEIDIKIARKIADFFKVSTRAASVRLEELALAPRGFYNKVKTELDKLDLPSSGGRGGGRTAPRKRLDELGLMPVDLIFGAHSRQRLNDFDVADYLDLTTGQVDDLRSIILDAA